MNTLNKINGIIFSETFPKQDYEVMNDSETCCCVCFSEKDYIYKVSLMMISSALFELVSTQTHLPHIHFFEIV